jgi:hypothetical protein
MERENGLLARCSKRIGKVPSVWGWSGWRGSACPVVSNSYSSGEGGAREKAASLNSWQYSRRWDEFKGRGPAVLHLSITEPGCGTGKELLALLFLRLFFCDDSTGSGCSISKICGTR